MDGRGGGQCLWEAHGHDRSHVQVGGLVNDALGNHPMERGEAGEGKG